jgi:glutamyl-Q tRNA(Asp) synthetase
LPRYLHLPLVLGSDGEKLSKQNGAQAVDLSNPAAALREAGHALGLPLQAADLGDLQAEAVQAWRAVYCGPELV